MVKKKKKGGITKAKKDDLKKSNNRKKIYIPLKKSLHLKINDIIKYIKTYKDPNEYKRQDQEQKLIKYMKIFPVEYQLK